MSLTKADDRTFASVLADGRIHITVPEGTEGSVIRKFKTSDDKEGEKCEMVYKDIKGMISKIAFHDGDYGTQLQVTITDGDEKPIVLSLGTGSNFGEDLMKKLPNVDLSKSVKIAPYSFTDDNKKTKKGITISQHDGKEVVKLNNYFYDTETKKNLHGFPEPSAAIKKLQKEGKKISADKWKLYFGECREFLVEFITTHFKIEAEPVNKDDDFEKEETS